MPPQLRYPYIVEYLVERHLLAQAAVKDGVAESEEYKRRLALYQAKALRDAYYAEKIKPTVTEEEIKAAYDTESAKVAQTERVRARHILVRTEAEAKQIVEKLMPARNSPTWRRSTASTVPRSTAVILATSPPPKWYRNSRRRPLR